MFTESPKFDSNIQELQLVKKTPKHLITDEFVLTNVFREGEGSIISGYALGTYNEYNFNAFITTELSKIILKPHLYKIISKADLDKIRGYFPNATQCALPTGTNHTLSDTVNISETYLQGIDLTDFVEKRNVCLMVDNPSLMTLDSQ